MKKSILGISAFYHDSAAALIIDGKIIAAAHEERFSRKKHDSSFPVHAIRYVLYESGLDISDLYAIAFYDKPFLKFERLLETYHAFAPRGLKSFIMAITVWIKEKLFLKKIIWEEIKKIEGKKLLKEPILLFPEHHLSHAASAFYPSPFEKAAILTMDGVGEWATTTIGIGENNNISILRELSFPHSLGLLYSAFTYYCGFKVNSGEYKLMGLAPYGNIEDEQVLKFKKSILKHLVDLREDGSLLLNMDYFNYAVGLRMCKDKKWEELFGIPRREPEDDLDQSYMNLALAIQIVLEECVLKLAKTAQKITNCENLVMAGGVALNCVANGRLLKDKTFKNIWIQPAAGDAGGALGAAYSSWYIWDKNQRTHTNNKIDEMQGSYLGPEYSNASVEKLCRKYNLNAKKFANFSELCEQTSEFLSQGNVIGWFQGKLEWGPRALGNRSILGDARNPEMQKKLNLKIKYREGFRPFAPSVLAEDIQEYFDLNIESPYMLLVAPVVEKRYKELPQNYNELPLFDRLYHIRSDIPAVTHINFSARIQSVNKKTNEKYWQLINEFKKKTGYGLVVNTSFNVRGEPIVCSPNDAYRCFMRTEMDYLVINDYLFKKEDQPEWIETADWKNEYELD